MDELNHGARRRGTLGVHFTVVYRPSESSSIVLQVYPLNIRRQPKHKHSVTFSDALSRLDVPELRLNTELHAVDFHRFFENSVVEVTEVGHHDTELSRGDNFRELTSPKGGSHVRLDGFKRELGIDWFGSQNQSPWVLREFTVRASHGKKVGGGWAWRGTEGMVGEWLKQANEGGEGESS